MAGKATYKFRDGKEIKGDLKEVERQVKGNEEKMEEIMPNLGLTWYAIALEYKSVERYDLAMENLKLSQQYIPSSSDLNKLVHQQIEIIQKKLDEIEGL